VAVAQNKYEKGVELFVTTRLSIFHRFAVLPLALLVGLILTAENTRLAGDEPSNPASAQTENSAQSKSPATPADSQQARDSKAAVAQKSGTAKSDAGKAEPAAKQLVTVSKNTPTTAEDLATIQAAIQQAVKKAMPATVGVSIRGTFGSGVVVTEDGYVLTAGHVAARPDQDAFIIFPDGKRVRAKTLGMNFDMDSGMLKITEEGKYPYVEMARSRDLRLGQWCVTLGHPGGIQRNRPPVVRAGRILFMREDAIATDCTLMGGDSGGPLLDTAGRLIGIHSRISEEVIDNYHVPIDTYRDTWERLARGDAWGGPIRGPILGINGQNDPAGCLIINVFNGSAADTAGLKIDDIITHFAAEEVKGLTSLQFLIAKRKAGDEVTVKVRRGGQTLELKAKLGGIVD
jgi:serine protease Do